MSTQVPVSAAFEKSVTDVGADNNTTVIELSTFENANTRVPPVVTGTVYHTGLVPESDEDEEHLRTLMDNRLHSFHVDGMQQLLSEEELMCVDRSLKEKATEILQMNPWLASRIVKSKGSKGSKLAMKFPTKISERQAQKLAEKVVRIVTTMAAGFNNSFGAKKIQDSNATTRRALAAALSPSATSIIIADPITENTYDDIVDTVRPFLHANTDSVVGSSCTLWDVLVIPMIDAATSQRTNKFLLVHSLNFCLADPATLYKIYRMLVAESPVERLNPNRCESIDIIKKKVLGEDPNFMRSKGIQVSIARRFARAQIGTKFTNQTSIWTIDKEKIKAIKEADRTKPVIAGCDNKGSANYEPPVKYITTNDILTSWFLTQNTDSKVGCLMVDIRGMDHEIDPDKAGNYQSEIVYNRWDDTRTPAWIRASLSRKDELLKRHGSTKLPNLAELSGGLLPKKFQSKGAPGVSTVSNWSRLIGSGTFETAFLEHGKHYLSIEPEVHLPILLQHNGMLSKIGWNSLTIFRYSKEKVGVLVVAPTSVTEDETLPFDQPALFRSLT